MRDVLSAALAIGLLAAAPVGAYAGDKMPMSKMPMSMSDKPAHFKPILSAYTANHQFLVKITGLPDPIPRELKANPFNAAGRYSDQLQGPNAKRLEFLPAPTAKRGAFKTPTLRNVARTAPYLHNGRFSTLQQVGQFYADGTAASQGNLVGEREGTLDLIPHFTPAEVADLVVFLKFLDSAPLPLNVTEQPERKP